MKKILASLLLITSFSLNAACEKDNTGFYLGGDFQIRRLCYKECYAGQKIVNYSPRTNAYLGYRFNDYVGVELGYGYSTSKNKGSVFTGEMTDITPPISRSNSFDQNNNSIPQNHTVSKTEEATPSPRTSTRIIDGKYVALHNKIKSQGIHINLAGFYPLPDFNATELVGSIGIFSLRNEYNRQIQDSSGEVRNIKTKTTTGDPVVALRLTAGIQSMVTENIRVRFSVGWLNTSKYVISYGCQECGVWLLQPLTAKDMLFYGIGLNWKF